MTKRKLFRSLAIILGLLLLAPGVRAEDKPLKKITISYTAHSNLHMPFFIAQKMGYFREEGLKAEMVLMRGEIAVKSAATDSLDYTAGAGGALPAILRGLKMRIVFVICDSPSDIHIVTQQKIKSFEDLKGGTFATSGLGDFTDILTRAVLRRNHIDPDKDVTMMTLGTSGDRYAAIKSGAVTAGTLVAPHNFIAVQNGMKQLASMGQYLKLVYGGIALSENKLQKDPDEVKRVLRATLKGLIFYRTKKDETQKMIAEEFKVDPKTAAQMWQATLDGMTQNGTVDEKMMLKLIAPVEKAVKPKKHYGPSDVFDFALLDQVSKELQASHWKP